MEKAGWLSQLKEAPYLGRIHPDTYEFSDIKKLSVFKQAPYMKQIDIYHDSRLVFGFEVHYCHPS